MTQGLCPNPVCLKATKVPILVVIPQIRPHRAGHRGAVPGAAPLFCSSKAQPLIAG